jgi:hypothetical protein
VRDPVCVIALLLADPHQLGIISISTAPIGPAGAFMFPKSVKSRAFDTTDHSWPLYSWERWEAKLMMVLLDTIGHIIRPFSG